MSCQQNQQQCQPPVKCPSKCTLKCPPKCPSQCTALCPVSSCCSSSSGGCCSSGGGSCCLSHYRCHRSHCHRSQSSNCCECEPSWGSSCCHSSGSCWVQEQVRAENTFLEHPQPSRSIQNICYLSKLNPLAIRGPVTQENVGEMAQVPTEIKTTFPSVKLRRVYVEKIPDPDWTEILITE
ncbi:late cornified envelope protein 2A-like [Piliocolobus tephrosceles]|nr:late cornified envelope protein 2A-like [Piliocolobus tephrosceles]